MPRWKEVWDALDISNDDFIRTTDEERHEEPVQKFVQALYDKGEIYLGVYKGLYCVGCEAFKTEDELVDGKCPLHRRRARGRRRGQLLLPARRSTRTG